ncbi:MAG: hypothetical protein M1814_003403 [Vezdaea aestivalis]|nr:MAG: hypothetical protein M1814_003403 [Vezdaea aestivalis]
MGDDRKSVLVTGSSPGGIGFSIAQQFHSKGLRVFATARNRVVLSELEEQGIETISLDVNSADDIEAITANVAQLTGGKLDFLVNNA